MSCHAFPGSWIPQLLGSTFPSVVRSSGPGYFAHVGWSPCSHGVSFGSSLSFRLGEPPSSIPSVGSVSTFRWCRSKGGNGMEKGKRKGAVVQVEYTLAVLFPSCSGIGPHSRSPRFLDSDWSSRGEGCVCVDSIHPPSFHERRRITTPRPTSAIHVANSGGSGDEIALGAWKQGKGRRKGGPEPKRADRKRSRRRDKRGKETKGGQRTREKHTPWTATERASR